MNEKQKVGFTHGPGRVVINREGEATTPFRAHQEHGITPTIMFVRDDGWTLGAPPQFEKVAFEMWPEQWIGFSALPTKKFRPIKEYGRNSLINKHLGKCFLVEARGQRLHYAQQERGRNPFSTKQLEKCFLVATPLCAWGG